MLTITYSVCYLLQTVHITNHAQCTYKIKILHLLHTGYFTLTTDSVNYIYYRHFNNFLLQTLYINTVYYTFIADSVNDI